MFAILQPQSAVRRYHTRVGTTNIYSEVMGSGPPIVLIHGLGGSTRWWQRNRHVLARHHEVHLIDLVGCGRSSGSFVLADAADQLTTWAWQQGLTRVSLIGHSMGGHIGACLAASNPQLVDRLVLVGAAVNCPGQPSANIKVQGLPVPLSMMPVVLEDVHRTGLLVLARVVYQLLKADMRATLANIQAPTLLVWGEHDSTVPLSLARAALTHLPKARLAVIANAGHAPMWEQPLAFNHTVLSFLNDRPIEALVSAAAL